MIESVLPALFADAGLWISFVFSLLIFSALLGDHALTRLAQYVLVGVSLGYLGILAIQFGLRPFVSSLLASNSDVTWNLITAILALGLAFAGSEHIFTGKREDSPTQRLGSSFYSALLRWLGEIPLGILLGVGITITLAGALQGTILPQFWLLATRDLDWQASLDLWIAGLFSFLITAGVLFHLLIQPQAHLDEQPWPIRQLMHSWMWLGQRALWLAAGVLFARLFASRLSVLIAQVEVWRGWLRW